MDDITVVAAILTLALHSAEHERTPDRGYGSLAEGMEGLSGGSCKN